MVDGSSGSSVVAVVSLRAAATYAHISTRVRPRSLALAAYFSLSLADYTIIKFSRALSRAHRLRPHTHTHTHARQHPSRTPSMRPTANMTPATILYTHIHVTHARASSLTVTRCIVAIAVHRPPAAIIAISSARLQDQTPAAVAGGQLCLPRVPWY